MRLWLTLPFVVACGTAKPSATSTSTQAAPAEDRLGELARAALRSGCDGKVASPPVPQRAEGARGAGDVNDDLVVYTAHPDDEAMYGGGTMAAVVRGGRRVALVVMSHGEGGRLLEVVDGKVVERRDRPEAEVAALRDRELAAAVARIGVHAQHLYPADARVDYGWTTSCSEALAHWDGALPSGVRGILDRLIRDIRTRRPRVIMTLDPRDDPQASHHGHHRAVGVLVELAARAAADPAFLAGAGSPPHIVEELVTFAPKDAPSDLALNVGSEARLAMLGEYPSQFREFDDLARRSTEYFVVRWRTSVRPVLPEITGGAEGRR